MQLRTPLPIKYRFDLWVQKVYYVRVYSHSKKLKNYAFLNLNVLSELFDELQSVWELMVRGYNLQ